MRVFSSDGIDSMRRFLPLTPLLIFFSLFFLSGCFAEYFDYWESQHTKPKVSEEVVAGLSGSLIVLPDERERANLVWALQNAKKRIWVETYTWTEKETQAAFIDAKNRWLDLRVILEENVYETPRINDPAIKSFRSHSIQAEYSSDDFAFTHMKLWIIDNLWCVSTGNWSYSSFTKNREFIFCSTDESILLSLEEIFLSDFKHIPPVFSKQWLDARIWLAPFNLRDFLNKQIFSAKNEIIAYNQSISDPEILKILSEKQKNHVHVELCQSTKSSTGSDYFEIPLFTSDKPYLHAKIFLLDGKDIILWSANMTSNAIDNNREIMIKIENNPSLYSKIRNLYNIDCKKQP